jgi:hypothetical protein
MEVVKGIVGVCFERFLAERDRIGILGTDLCQAVSKIGTTERRFIEICRLLKTGERQIYMVILKGMHTFGKQIFHVRHFHSPSPHENDSAIRIVSYFSTKIEYAATTFLMIFFGDKTIRLEPPSKNNR